MALSDAIRALRDRVMADLVAAHDYYADTKIAWRLVRRFAASGRTVRSRNNVTGTITTQAELAKRARGYITEQLAEATFQQFIAIFENFYFDLLRLWLTAYPASLGKKMVDLKTILGLPDKDAITELIVRKEVNEVLYDRPSAWFAYLEEKAKLGCPSGDESKRFAEAKAARDLLVHNQGIANRTYEEKAGDLARCREGERVEISEPYHRATWELIRTLVADLSDAAIVKAS